MSSVALTLARENLPTRQALAFSLSLALHLTLGIFIIALARYEPPPAPPLEISLFPGPLGPASPPPGEKSMEPGPIGPPPEAVVPAPPEAPKAAPAVKPKPSAKKPVTRVVRPAPPAPRVEDQGLLGALRKSGPAPSARTQVFEGVQSSVQLRQRPSEGDATTGTNLGVPRSKADASVGADIIPSGPAVTGSIGSGVGSVVLPGPGGSGSGWGGGGSGSGGGGTGRGGFSVSGAGSGGAGRSYASIWNYTQRYLAGLRWAYNNELRKSASLRGVLVVRYEILASGEVGQVTLVSSGLRDAGLEREVLNQIRTWRYPPESSGSVLVTWPFSFVPPSG